MRQSKETLGRGGRAGRQGVLRFVRDGAVGTGVFVALVVLVAGHTGAQAQVPSGDLVTFTIDSVALGQQLLAQLPLTGEPIYASWLPGNVFRRADPVMATVLLGLVFSILTALNIGFWRHLVQAYASERAVVGRRSR